MHTSIHTALHSVALPRACDSATDTNAPTLECFTVMHPSLHYRQPALPPACSNAPITLMHPPHDTYTHISGMQGHLLSAQLPPSANHTLAWLIHDGLPHLLHPCRVSASVTQASYHASAAPSCRMGAAASSQQAWLHAVHGTAAQQPPPHTGLGAGSSSLMTPLRSSADDTSAQHQHCATAPAHHHSAVLLVGPRCRPAAAGGTSRGSLPEWEAW